MSDLVTHAFATPIYYRRHTDTAPLNQTLAATIRDLAAHNPSDDAHRAHRGGYYSPGTFFQSEGPGVREVVALIRDGIGEMTGDLGVASTVTSIDLQGWVALTRAGDYQTPHVHAGSMLSGIYYVETPLDRPEPEGCIDLITPLTAQEMTFLKGFSRTYCRVPVSAGGLLIFPSYLRHFTHPFEGDAERICVVFNAFARQQR